MCVGAFSLGCAPKGNVSRPNIHELVVEAIEHNAEQPQGELLDGCPDDFCPLGECGDESAVVPSVFEEDLPAPYADESQLAEEVVEEPLLSEEFIETDVREAVLLLSEEAGEEVVLDDQVRGIVNVSITELTFDHALEKILLPLNYVHVKRDGRHYVSSPDPKSPLFHLVAVQREYHPSHLTPEALLEATPQAMKKYVQVIDGANMLMIYAPEQHGQVLLDQFMQLDQPIPQVLLEAYICVVSPDCGFRFGVNWGHAVELDGKTAFDLGVSGLDIGASVSPQGFDAIFKDFATTSFFIRKLAEHGYLTIRAAPRVMAKDGEQANIAINRETFFTVQPFPSGSDGDNNSFFFQQDIQKVESGIALDITPRIHGDSVTVKIERAEVSEDIRNANVESAVNPFPIINRRSVSTTVNVKDGRTLVIGGLVQRETVDRVNKVPGLSKLPVMGRLFKNNQTQTREVEVVIFISPKIVDASQLCDKPCLKEEVFLR